MEYHRNGVVWIHATCVACDLQWKERYRFDFAYETVTPKPPAEPRRPERTTMSDNSNREPLAPATGSASWSTNPPNGPGYFWSRSHGGTPVIAWYTDSGIRMSCDQTVIVLDSDEGRDWMATQEIEFWPEPVGSAYAMQDIAHEALTPNHKLTDATKGDSNG
jgi:hypothetical protein